MAEEQNITPRNNNFLLGQDEAQEIFLRAYKTDTMHHAFILNGPQGVGKATLAYKIARFLLAADDKKKQEYTSLNISENSPIFQQVANGSHPDLMVLERDFTETDKKKIISAIKHGEVPDEAELATYKRSAFIRVDDVRKANEFLSKTSFNDGWRVVIIDSADDMNKSAANALLKILEEPPARTLLLLISHNTGNLLPTIRSRCTRLPIHTLDNTTVASLLRRYRPDLNSAMVQKLTEMSGGSIGKAILYADVDAVEIYEDLCAILCAGNRYSLSKMLDFTAEAAKNNEKFNVLQGLILRFLKEHVNECKDIEALYQCWQKTQKGFADCANVNMDKRFMLITLLTEICKVL